MIVRVSTPGSLAVQPRTVGAAIHTAWFPIISQRVRDSRATYVGTCDHGNRPFHCPNVLLPMLRVAALEASGSVNLVMQESAMEVGDPKERAGSVSATRRLPHELQRRC